MSEKISKKKVLSTIEIDSDYNFKLIIKNNTDSNIFYYKCFSIQDIELNENLLFEFTITDKQNNFVRNLNKSKINYITTKCLTLIKPNNSDTLQFNLKGCFSNIQSVNFLHENLRVNIMYKILRGNELFKEKKEFIVYSLPIHLDMSEAK